MLVHMYAVILYVIILFNISILLYNKTSLFSNQVTVISPTGADPGFLMRGFKWPKGDSFWYFYLNYHENPHEIEIKLSKRGVRAKPLNPLWIRHCSKCFILVYKSKVDFPRFIDTYISFCQIFLLSFFLSFVQLFLVHVYWILLPINHTVGVLAPVYIGFYKP